MNTAIAIASQWERLSAMILIKRYVDARFFSASEAFWRICSFDSHGREPSTQQLAVNEKNAQMITFNENSPEAAISSPKDTTFASMV